MPDRSRTLPFLRRTDLVFRQTSFGDRVYWTVKDPISLEFFQLREEEHFIFSRLTKDATVDSIIHSFNGVFAPVRLSLGQFDSYLRTLLAMGLISPRSGGASGLMERHDRIQRLSWLAALGNPLVIRWRGVDPSPLLNVLYPAFRWCFRPGFVVASLLLMCFAVVWMWVQHAEFATRLPAMSAFISVHNLVWIAVALGVAKIVHEFAHALTCKHFGGSCHEMGLMLLVFTPCLYCNVSDAWMMPNRWHRIAVSGAGIFVELLLAAGASLLWWASEPGILNSICLNMMIVCSVNTLLFNGNPLLKYDGYYVLADLVGVPNLSARAKTRLADGLVRLTCGVPFANPRSLPARAHASLIAYGVAAFIYRWIVLCLILWSLHQLLRPIGLVVIAQVVTVSCGLTFLFSGFRSWRATARKLMTLPLRKGRLVASLTILAFGLHYAWHLPVPRHVTAPVTIEPTRVSTIYIEESGRLERRGDVRVNAGDEVTQGDVLATLDSPQLSREILELRERVEVLRLRVATLKDTEVRLGRPNENLPAAQEVLASLEEQMDRFRVRHGKLTLRAEEGGIIMHPESKVLRSEPHRLRRWAGSPMDESNLGSTLERGTVYCLIGDPEDLSAILVVDETDVELLQVGQSARVWLREHPGDVVSGTVVKISTKEMESAPDSLVSKDDVTMIDEGGGQSRLANTSFRVRVSLDRSGLVVPIRSTGWAKVTVVETTIGSRIKEYLLRTFRLAQAF
ncbi:MAG: biotin/lipoyl-binding protein [Planctomycetota bacterium]